MSDFDFLGFFEERSTGDFEGFSAEDSSAFKRQRCLSGSSQHCEDSEEDSEDDHPMGDTSDASPSQGPLNDNHNGQGQLGGRNHQGQMGGTNRQGQLGGTNHQGQLGGTNRQGQFGGNNRKPRPGISKGRKTGATASSLNDETCPMEGMSGTLDGNFHDSQAHFLLGEHSIFAGLELPGQAIKSELDLGAASFDDHGLNFGLGEDFTMAKCDATGDNGVIKHAENDKEQRKSPINVDLKTSESISPNENQITNIRVADCKKVSKDDPTVDDKKVQEAAKTQSSISASLNIDSVDKVGHPDESTAPLLAVPSTKSFVPSSTDSVSSFSSDTQSAPSSVSSRNFTDDARPEPTILSRNNDMSDDLPTSSHASPLPNKEIASEEVTAKQVSNTPHHISGGSRNTEDILKEPVNRY